MTTIQISPTVDDDTWRQHGACRRPGTNPDWWTGGRTQLGNAVWICRNACPVRAECHRWADQHRELARASVYGGVYWSSRTLYGKVQPCGIQPVARDPGVMPPRCGTQAAISRHRRRGQMLDDECLAFDRERKRAERRAAA